MAGNLYLTVLNGIKTLVAALQTSAGAGDAGKLVALDPTGKISDTMMPVGIGAETAVIAVSESLAAGDWVNIYGSSGAKCRKADATTAGKEAHGFVLAAANFPGDATVYGISQMNNQLSGLTPGEMYWLSTTAGQGVATTPPSASGNVVQRLGKAVSATEIVFSPDDPVVIP
jgi:hypothetical protein